MSILLTSHRFHATRGAALAAYCTRERIDVELMVLPAEVDARLPDADCARVEDAFFSGDVFPDFSRQFFSTVRKARKLRWLHVFNAGVDHPIYGEMLQRGARLTTSAGTAAVPIAQTAIMGLLMLARHFPHWLAGQRDRRWDPMRGADVPRDLAGQTAVVLGLGNIGNEVARLCRALGLVVIGVRRGGPRPGDAVDQLHKPEALASVLPRADWLIVACPLTAETKGWIDAAMLARLPRGARVVNVARGEIIDEGALTAALRDGRLGGAYLDVFGKEPLSPESPLWNLPNVFVTPHNAGAAAGNDDRIFGLFLDNLRRISRGEPLVNEVTHV